MQLLLAAVVAFNPPSALAARLLSGTVVELELLQTISSRYSDPGLPIYFRVQRDVMADGEIVVRGGALVTGKLVSLAESGMSARSAALSLDVSSVPTVDEKSVRVIASMTRAGRNRDDAMTWGFIFVGVFGLLTKGSDVWIPAGSLLEAQVLNDRLIDVSKVSTGTPGAAAPTSSRATVTKVGIDGMAAGAVRINIDNPSTLGMLRIQLGYKSDSSTVTRRLEGWQVIQVGDVELPQPLDVNITEAELSIPAWSVLQYCRAGQNRILLRAPSGEGQIDAEALLQFEPIIRR